MFTRIFSPESAAENPRARCGRKGRPGARRSRLPTSGNLYGAIEFYKECKSAGIKPIIGLSAHIGDGKRLLLYAKDHTGYQNLLAIVTNRTLSSPTSHSDRSDAHRAWRWTDPARPKAAGIALPEIFYLKAPTGARGRQCARSRTRAANEGGEIDAEELDYHLPSAKEMATRYSKEELAKTLEIAEQCNLELALGKWVFPNYELTPGLTYDEMLRVLIEKGIKERKLEGDQATRERIEYEFKIISGQGLLAVLPGGWPTCSRLRGKTKSVTTIRGSVAGSMVTFGHGGLPT